MLPGAYLQRVGVLLEALDNVRGRYRPIGSDYLPLLSAGLGRVQKNQHPRRRWPQKSIHLDWVQSRASSEIQMSALPLRLGPRVCCYRRTLLSVGRFPWWNGLTVHSR